MTVPNNGTEWQLRQRIVSRSGKWRYIIGTPKSMLKNLQIKAKFLIFQSKLDILLEYEARRRN